MTTAELRRDLVDGFRYGLCGAVEGLAAPLLLLKIWMISSGNARPLVVCIFAGLILTALQLSIVLDSDFRQCLDQFVPL